jgi:hypothetical protein
MNNLSIQCDLINHAINIVDGFAVDYSDSIKSNEKDFNNNGIWGKIVNKGVVVKSLSFNPNRHHNYESDYSIKLKEAKIELLKLKH